MIKVLVVDDSALVREMITAILKKDPSIEVVGTASDPYIARDRLLKVKPDVITLDVEMPRMDGITFLKKIMKFYPIPVVIVSSLTQKGMSTSLEAMEAGAVEIVAKPNGAMSTSIESVGNEIIWKVKAAARARVGRSVKVDEGSKKRKNNVPVADISKLETTNKIIAIGASTGGTEALKVVMKSMPADSPGVVIVQHMPEKFTTTFAQHLNNISAMEVREAKKGESVIPGRALLAPGNKHMVLKRSGARYYVDLNQAERVCYQRPSVEVLFNSVAKFAGANAVGVIMTGMGGDGAKGLLNMKNAGAKTIAQDENSCIVYGMPKEAVEIGAVNKVVPLRNISKTIFSFFSK